MCWKSSSGSKCCTSATAQGEDSGGPTCQRQRPAVIAKLVLLETNSALKRTTVSILRRRSPNPAFAPRLNNKGGMFIAERPSIPGCTSQGQTGVEAETNMRVPRPIRLSALSSAGRPRSFYGPETRMGTPDKWRLAGGGTKTCVTSRIFQVESLLLCFSATHLGGLSVCASRKLWRR